MARSSSFTTTTTTQVFSNGIIHRPPVAHIASGAAERAQSGAHGPVEHVVGVDVVAEDFAEVVDALGIAPLSRIAIGAGVFNVEYRVLAARSANESHVSYLLHVRGNFA